MSIELSDAEAKEENQSSQKPPTHQELTLDEYLKIACMIISGVDINRVESIKYVANKLGG